MNLLSSVVLGLSAVAWFLSSLLCYFASRSSLAYSSTFDGFTNGFLSVLSVGFTGGFSYGHYNITNEKKIPKFYIFRNL